MVDMVTPLTGLGVWVWKLDHCFGGNIPAMVAQAQRAGVSWVAIKAADGGTRLSQFKEDVVNAFRANGIEVAAWWYSRPKSATEELIMLHQILSMGVQHFIMDAELEWESEMVIRSTKDGTSVAMTIVHDWRSEAAKMAAGIRKIIGPEMFFADAPWWITRAHRMFPFNEFGAICNARMPQAYYAMAEEGGESASKYLADGDLLWAASGVPVYPILSPVNGDATRHASLVEFDTALDRYVGRGATSIWSWDSMSRSEWSVLEKRANV
jgi:hypothetical protein